MIKNQKMGQIITTPIITENDIIDLCRPHDCVNQAMVIVLIEILNQQGEGSLAKKRQKKMKDACIYAKQSEIENFAGRVFMALNTLCCQNSETQLNDLESFIELMRCIYHREFDEAIEWFNKLTSTDKEKGWESKKYYLEKLFQYCSHTESVEMFKREFYTQKF